MTLHAQDVVVLLKLLANRDASKRPTYSELSKALFMSASQVFRSVDRAEASHLLTARIYDVAVGCGLALLGTLAATYPRVAPKTS